MVELTHLSTNRKSVRDVVAAHPMVAFLTLAFAISWIAWTLSYRIDLGVVNGFGIIGSTGPALAAMIVSAFLRPEPSGIAVGKRWRLFGMIGILALASMAVRRLWVTPTWLLVAGDVTAATAFPSFWAFLVDVLAAVVVAFVLSGVYSSRQGVRDLLHSLDPRGKPVRWYWWAIAVGLYPVVLLLGNAISTGLGQPEPSPTATGLWYILVLDALLTALYFLIGGGGLEEPGWRGFALPTLEKQYSPWRSSLILAVFWTLWHLPFFWFGDLQGGLVGVVLYFLLEVAPLAFLFTAVFNRTGGSLPIVILLHTSINVTPLFLPVSSLAPIVWLLLTLGIILWMWRAPQTFAPRDV